MSEEIKMTTPGPWIVQTPETKDSTDIFVLRESTGEAICVTGYLPNSEALANAALIAVAPEMLDLLIDIQQMVINPDTDAVTDLITIDERIQTILAKLANEVGEE